MAQTYSWIHMQVHDSATNIQAQLLLPAKILGNCSSAYLERIVPDAFNDIPEEDLGGKGVAMVDDGFPIGPLPAVKLHTSAPFHQCSAKKSR